MIILIIHYYSSFFFNDTATTEIYTLSLHDALPIFKNYAGMTESDSKLPAMDQGILELVMLPLSVRPSFELSTEATSPTDRKSTRLNSSHLVISYAVFCLKKKKSNNETYSSYSLRLH